MKEFFCYGCRRYKKIELYGKTLKNKQKLCSACVENIRLAEIEIGRRRDEA